MENMAGVDREFTATLNALRSRGCHVGQEWLLECINFFRSENNQYALRDLENFVYEQWTLADLREIAGVGSFPPNLDGILKTTLEGKMACQVQYVTDIGHSSYSQMQKVRKEDVGNLNIDDAGKEFQQAWEPKSNRMLQLCLCDGVQTIKAIEYRPISFLKADLVPGSKVLIQGPVLCRRGILMLEEKHITLLGGEVDALVIPNAYENVLARNLNLPENPDPYNINDVQNQVSSISVDDSQNLHPTPQEPQRQACTPQANIQQPLRQLPSQKTGRQPLPSQPKSKPPSNHFQTNSVKEVGGPAKSAVAFRNNPPTLPYLKSDQQSTNSLSRNLPLEFSGSDEDFLNIPLNDCEWNVDWENEKRRSLHRPTLTDSVVQTKNSTSTFNTDYDMGSDEEAMLLEAEASLAINLNSITDVECDAFKTVKDRTSSLVERSCTDSAISKRLTSSAFPEESLKKPLFAKRRKESSSQEVSSTTDINCLVKDNFLGAKETVLQDVITPTKISFNPFVYLSHIVELKTNNPIVYKVKAAVITVIEKLSISNENWKLSAKISDGSANVDVRFSSIVLNELIGMSAKTLVELKSQMVQQPEKKEIVRKTLECAQIKLINLNCLLKVQVSENGDLPCVVGLEELSMSTINALRDRI